MSSLSDIINAIKNQPLERLKLFIKVFVFVLILISTILLTRFACSKEFQRDIMLFRISGKMYKLPKMYDYYYDLHEHEQEHRVHMEDIGQYYQWMAEIKERVHKANEEQIIMNQDKYGNVTENTFVMVIQVHHGHGYLIGLLHSLKTVLGMPDCLLIFSHDYYDENLNELIEDYFSFTRYVQIYYPYSSQIYPKEFLGPVNNLCAGDPECESYASISKTAQKKLFWWWQVTFVFNHLRAIRHYQSRILFLEENQYVLVDAIYIARLLDVMLSSNCSDCEVISLGAYRPKPEAYHLCKLNLTINSWNSIESNVGIGFNRSVWNTIQKYSSHFCHHNDHRWDVSLKYLASKTSQRVFKVFACEAPRVINYKECKDNEYCPEKESILQLVNFTDSVLLGLFPLNLEVKVGEAETQFCSSEAGGWDVNRDAELCMDIITGA